MSCDSARLSAATSCWRRCTLSAASTWIATVPKTLAISDACWCATSQKRLRSKLAGMERASKRGFAVDEEQPQGECECPVCLEVFDTRVRQRTVARGVPQRVERCFPFDCGHAVCVSCDARLQSRGDGRCPLCRAERTARLNNDARDSESALIQFLRGSWEGIHHDVLDLSGDAERARQNQAARERELREALEQDVAISSDISFPDGFPQITGGQRVRRLVPSGAPVPLTHGARQLVAALTRITSMSLGDFRRSAISVRPISGEEPVVLTVRQVRPARW